MNKCKQEKFKKGDIVELKGVRYGSEGEIGDTFKITDTQGCPSKYPSSTWNYTGKSLCDGCSANIVHGDLIPACRSKEDKIACANKKLKVLQKDIKKVEDEIDFLTNYEDAEDFLAHKLSEIMKSGGDIEVIKKALKKKMPTHLL